MREGLPRDRNGIVERSMRSKSRVRVSWADCADRPCHETRFGLNPPTEQIRVGFCYFRAMVDNPYP